MNEFELSGLDELVNDLEKAIKIYPDFAEDSLKKMGTQLKKDVVKETKATVKKHTGKLIKGYKVSKVQGYGTNMFVEFSGTAPHFHLIENGHVKKSSSGQTLGFKEGYHIVSKTAAGYNDKMADALNVMVNKILRESDLT